MGMGTNEALEGGNTTRKKFSYTLVLLYSKNHIPNLIQTKEVSI